MTAPRGRLDKDAARELELYIDNDGQLHRSQAEPIRLNLRRKIANGTFNPTRSVDLWMYLTEAGAKKYHAEFGDRHTRWNDMFSRPTRLFVAKRMALQFMQDEGLDVPKSAWDELSLED